MNVRLLRKIQKHILDEPRRFAMGIVQREGKPGEPAEIGRDSFNACNPYENGQRFAECGTMACIMGWGRILGGTRYQKSEMWSKLCAAGSWPTSFRRRYQKAKTPLTRARIAVARIEHFIKTKGQD